MKWRATLGGFALGVALGCGNANAQIGAVPDCTASVRPSEVGLILNVFYRCRSNAALFFRADGAPAAAKVLEFRDGAGHGVERSGSGWRVEPRDGSIEARYRFDLGGYARDVDDVSVAVRRGEGVLSLLSSWLLEPRGFDRLPVIDIRAEAPAGFQFQTGMPPTGDAWRLSGVPISFAGYTAIGRLSMQDIVVPAPGTPGQAAAATGEAVVHLAILDGLATSAQAGVGEWVRRTALAESNYWDGFTAGQMLIGLVPMSGRSGLGYGRTVSGGGPTVMVEIGANVDVRRLYDEWVLVHELIHTGMPYVTGRAAWFMEGAATYAEPVIRARAGWKTESDVWREWIGQMPQGVSAFATGLSTASGRQNYWSGAIFMLLADLELRRTTAGAKGLEDCLKGALASGLDGATRASLANYASACDRATGTKVVSGLIEKHFDHAQPVDLASLWKALGVSLDSGKVAFDDTAPLAQWRKMIVTGPQGHLARTVPRPREG